MAQRIQEGDIEFKITRCDSNATKVKCEPDYRMNRFLSTKTFTSGLIQTRMVIGDSGPKFVPEVKITNKFTLVELAYLAQEIVIVLNKYGNHGATPNYYFNYDMKFPYHF